MPRAFDSDANPSELVFTENVECPFCGEIFEGSFYDYTKSLTVQDMTEAPIGEHDCTACNGRFSTSLSGWMFFGEAG